VADRVIICSGAKYRILFPHLLRESGLQLCKLQMMQTAPLPGFRLPHSILSGLSIRRYPVFASCPSYNLLQDQASDPQIHAYGIHLLFKQAPDGSVIIGDSHEYSSLANAAAFEERTNPLINAAILHYAQGMLALPSWDITALWNGYYLTHPERHVYTATINDVIHVVTGIGGKGMTTGPGFSRANIASLLA